jgi:predicted nucleic acid-binding protein
MPTVYLETSVIGYLASRRSSDLVIAANQLLTLEWWTDHRDRFQLFVSQATVDECAAGDPVAAHERLVFLDRLPILAVDSQTHGLAQALMNQVGLPSKAAVDAIHIAIAAQNTIDYLLTWNCKHIANPSFRHTIDRVLVDAGFASPVICTPQELLNV